MRHVGDAVLELRDRPFEQRLDGTGVLEIKAGELAAKSRHVQGRHDRPAGDALAGERKLACQMIIQALARPASGE